MWQLDWRASIPEPFWYDVDAKWSDPALRNKWPEMLQSLLAGRFSLVMRTEGRATTLYSLSVKRQDLLAKCQVVPADINKHRIQRSEDTTSYVEAPMNIIWQSAMGAISGARTQMINEMGIDGRYSISIEASGGNADGTLAAGVPRLPGAD
ncbi:MAG TPA: TIGR03435 family protein [Bryobacteraceae bacterium]|jgi:uncharacterized protein (TIGR03435 family)|nr:TIGR03435 family protein [Bryobacteraceae bacterium]